MISSNKRANAVASLPIIGLEEGQSIPDLVVMNEAGEAKLLSSFNPNRSIVRSFLNLSDAAKWQGPQGEQDLAQWATINRAFGCGTRAAELIKQHEQFVEADHAIEIVISNVTHEQLQSIKAAQLKRYQDHCAKNNIALPDDFVLPVTFVVLTPEAQQKLSTIYQCPVFLFKEKEYPYAQTFVLDKNKMINFKFTHQHIDRKRFNANNACAREVKEILNPITRAAVRAQHGLREIKKVKH